jgi:uncharacterized protein YecE (DUF72 family)
MWNVRTETSGERFDYWYQRAELEEWVPRIQWLDAHAPETYILFNTNNDDQGPGNARTLAGALIDAGLGGRMPQGDLVARMPLQPPLT